MQKIRVKILSSHKRIPFLDCYGPILTPVTIEKRKYEVLKKMGFKMEVVEDEKKEEVVEVEVPSKPEQDKQPEEVISIVEGSEETEDNTEEPEGEEKMEDETGDTEEEEEDLEYDGTQDPKELIFDREELTDMPKKKLKEILNKREVSFMKNSSREALIDLIIKSNP